MKLLIIDNYDSFTYNLYQYLGELLFLEDNTTGLHSKLDVIRNDELSLEDIRNRRYDRIVISPGPGDPSDRAYFGVCSQVITDLGKETPVMGVCLGMQGIAHYFGGKIKRAHKPMHGKTSLLEHDGMGLFASLPQNVEVMRYHSLVAEEQSLPDVLQVTARSADDGEIMGLRHRQYPVEGIQFHPESFATEGGRIMLKNFLLNDR